MTNTKTEGKKVMMWFSGEQIENLNEILKIREDDELSVSGLVRELMKNHLKELKKSDNEGK